MRVVGILLVITLFSMISSSCSGKLLFIDESELKKKLDELESNLEEIGKRIKIREDIEEWIKNAEKKFNETSKIFRKKWNNATSGYLLIVNKQRFIGKIETEDGYVIGNFVRFIFNDSSIIDYTILREESITVFDLIHIEGFEGAMDNRSVGSVWFALGKNAMIEVHDNPVRLIKITSIDNCSITFLLSADINANKTSSKIIEISGKVNGSLVLTGEGSIKVQNNTIYANISKSSNIMFLIHPELNATIAIPKQALHEKILVKAMEKGKLCARLIIDMVNSSDAMEFGNTTLSCKFEKNKIKIQVNGTGEEKILVIDLSHKVFNTSKLVVKLDNEELPLISYDTLLNMTGEEPACAIMNGSNGLQLLIYIPRFSSHFIEIYPYIAKKKIPGFDVSIIMCIAFLLMLGRYLRKR
ncbi:MAG: hypothetical protein J7L20_06135 [Thermoplasmata archaeon]|nr:hypothetical protein [Thermoplasmata archaeon]